MSFAAAAWRACLRHGHAADLALWIETYRPARRSVWSAWAKMRALAPGQVRWTPFDRILAQRPGEGGLLIHGAIIVRDRVGSMVGVIPPDFAKSDLFWAAQLGGMPLKKTFSAGHADGADTT